MCHRRCAVEILLHAVVGDEYISESITIVVGEGNAQEARPFLAAMPDFWLTSVNALSPLL
jgi:hypothetical protein